MQDLCLSGNDLHGQHRSCCWVGAGSSKRSVNSTCFLRWIPVCTMTHRSCIPGIYTMPTHLGSRWSKSWSIRCEQQKYHNGCDVRANQSPCPLRLKLVHPGARHGALPPLPRVAVARRKGGAALAVHSSVAVLPLVHGSVGVPIATCSSWSWSWYWGWVLSFG